VACSPGEAVRRLDRAVEDRREFRLLQASASGARLSRRPNWAVWGAEIALRFVPRDDDGTTVEVRWAPVVPTTLVVWGQGARDVRALERLLGADDRAAS